MIWNLGKGIGKRSPKMESGKRTPKMARSQIVNTQIQYTPKTRIPAKIGDFIVVEY